MTLNDLILRCEEADGADRELDARIHCEVRGWKFTQEGNDFVAIVPGIIKTIENRLWIGQLDPTQIPRVYTSRTDALSPCYTASLDAAMSLVPDSMEWRVEKRCSKGMRGAYASLWSVGARDVDFHANGHGKTPALALTAASLRAIAANKEEG
jgi:hypothetical protein